MKILYAVQGTGNGHISRANAMAESFLAYPDVEVSWLLSGREKSLGFGSIKEFIWREGMTFVVKNGKVKLFETLKKNKLVKFKADVKNLDLSPYDVVISDYEPVVCHAARKRGIPIWGIGHQYAFEHNIPKRGANLIANIIMRKFAPVSSPVGLHWHHFNCPILPPILDIAIPEVMPEIINDKVVVYLPFENISQIIRIFESIPGFDFYIYHPNVSDGDKGNIHTRSISRLGFKVDLLNTKSIICNSGFELISECLQIGKSILTKPIQGQMEQLSNARALEELSYADVMNELDEKVIRRWLHQDNKMVQVTYPNVADALAKWIVNGCQQTVPELAASLWQEPSLAAKVV